MNINDAYPSKYMKADDLEDGDLTVTIRDNSPVEWVEFPQKGKPTPDNKPVLYFKLPREAKAMVLNKTNWKTIGQVLGSDETEDWSGKQITLFATEVESFGEMALAIRVRLKKPQAAKPQNGSATPETRPTQPENASAGHSADVQGFNRAAFLEEIKALLRWPQDQPAMDAEKKRQLAGYSINGKPAEFVTDLTNAQLPEFKSGLEMWLSHQPSDDIPF